MLRLRWRILRLRHMPPAHVEKRRIVDLKVQVLGARKESRAQLVAKVRVLSLRWRSGWPDVGMEADWTLA